MDTLLLKGKKKTSYQKWKEREWGVGRMSQKEEEILAEIFITLTERKGTGSTKERENS